jgi:predicted GH43/DUF377 family glycosyl hydrolase
MLKAVGISHHGREIILYFAEQDVDKGRIFIATSKDGKSFSPPKDPLTLRPAVGQKIAEGVYSSIRVTADGQGQLITFLKTNAKGSFLYQAGAKKFDYWSKTSLVKGISEPAVAVLPAKNRKLIFFGNNNISLAVAGVRGSWKISPKPLLAARREYFDNSALTVGQAREVEQGILLTYYARYTGSGHKNLITVGAALFDKNDPAKLLWRSDYPLWQQARGHRHQNMEPIGEIDFQGQTLLYLQNEAGDIFSVALPLWNFFGRGARPKASHLNLERWHKNPVLSPRLENDWESKAAFNPAAFYAHGRVHLIYRAIGNDDISTFGYASSGDGVHFDERLDYPIYTPRAHFEGRALKKPPVVSRFASGGSGIGGCEDPRISLIDETLYMTYVAFDGYNPPRVALTTISLEDFLGHRWNWSEPVLISPYIPGEGNKNSCVLPGKINDQYVVFHRIWPDILIDYVDDLNFDGKKKFLSKAGHAKIKPRKMHWDSRKIGIGATPLKTDAGWLLIYQAVGNQDGAKYKIGAMLLDMQNPAKVVARAHVPVLEPEAWYENEGWKYGVVYPCGAAIVGNDLFVYYGGADTYTCVAKANLPEFLSNLLTHKPATLTQVTV